MTFRSVHVSEPDMQATQAALGRPVYGAWTGLNTCNMVVC